MKGSKYIVRLAEEPWELEEVCRMNHRTFSEEIQQHERSADGLLIDKFHEENQYLICLLGSEIVGMVALRGIRPFSLDYKLPNLDQYLPPNQSCCEIRLLTVKPEHRGSTVFFLLFKEAFAWFSRMKYDLGLISGILSQQKLYRSVGFVPFGPLVGDAVKFQPMYGTPAFFYKSRHHFLAQAMNNRRINALPGPVDISAMVAEEFRKTPESHRSEEFVQNYRRICESLTFCVNANKVQIFSGSGTLANEIMLSHLSGLKEKGLILSNGEFGDRLIHQAVAQNLDFITYESGFGIPFQMRQIAQLLEKDPEIGWLCLVHCETSNGLLNDLTALTDYCSQRSIKLVVDCISTFGILPLDLGKIYMASASSGKAIGSYSGLSMIFFNQLETTPNAHIPVYLDIRYYIQKEGIPFTLNSNSLYALGEAMKAIDINSRFQKIYAQSLWLRNRLSEVGLLHDSSGLVELHPAITTIQLPAEVNSVQCGQRLQDQQILVSYNSDYLIKGNRIQICLFSPLEEHDLNRLLQAVNNNCKV